ncbi:RNA-binding S4 domain-containing protein [Alkalilacustris brevis]|uniref:RNA-binding S4 domain-containing protein n=1 Tax=Alkalilacustris brevis TaxID=2026338 RepID=UPI000E0D1AB9|nr:RNA-binding S4 domain-containing protein [Alkalilacustris brevis]
MPPSRETIRLDKWLWQARFFKTRGLASRAVSNGQIRVNAARVIKPAQAVGAGDTLTFALGRQVKVVRILALGLRRGPAPEAQALYDDLSPPPPPLAETTGAPSARSGGRPSGKERRSFEQARRSALE